MAVTTPPDTGPSPPTRGTRLRFDRYLLDLDRGCLVLDGSDIALRPKTFAVLHYLIEHAGRLVSKEELLAAVWRNLVVTDDALVQSIGELRRALGDDGSRLIRTIPRRGYRFEAEVSAVSPERSPSPGSEAIVPAPGAEARAPEPAIGARTPLTLMAKVRARRGAWLLAPFALIALLVTAMLWGTGGPWSPVSDPGHGPRSAAEGLVFDAKPAIAVLPLVNQSVDSGRDYFADGLTQDIINALGRFSELTVISWNGVFPYKGKPVGPEAIGRALAVAYLVEGNVLRAGERVRVNAQLVDTRQGRVLWSGRFDEALADVFALQDNMTAQIVGALASRVTRIEQRRVLAKPTESLEAYDYVLRARPALQRPTRAGIAEARVLLKRAIEIDPYYAAAYAGLAETYTIDVSLGWAESPLASLDHAEELATRAVSLDHDQVRARVLLARAHIFHQRYERAEEEIERAIAINPNDAQSLAGRGNILLWVGQTDAAIDALEHAQRIDPDLNVVDRFALGLGYYLKGRYEAAAEQTELNLRQIAGASSSRVLLAAAYAQLNRTGDTARVVAEIRRVDPTFDAQQFGTKFLDAVHLEHLRDGLRKAGLLRARG